MFTERLKLKHLVEIVKKVSIGDGSFVLEGYEIDMHTTELKLELRLKNNPKYLLYFTTIRLYDFDLKTYHPVEMNENKLKREYIRYMSQTFGKEYRKAYFANCRKVFEDEE